MFDIAYYINDPATTGGPKEFNCAPHYDPGLFSLSVLSTIDGLELQSNNGDWIKGPTIKDPTVGVIWLGDAAKKATKDSPVPLKNGVHKVSYVNQEKIPRLTMWYEICTFSQITNIESMEGIFYTEDNTPAIKIKNIVGAPVIVSKKESTLNRKMEKITGVSVTKRAPPKFEFLRTAEKRTGVPISKSITPLIRPELKVKSNNKQIKTDLLHQFEEDYGVPPSKDDSFDDSNLNDD